ncbi:MAG TPA: IS110 family transposase [Acidimicrobiia bacterium]|nr:IS110 family transposase [Acidimicrobiia bacterium]
MIGVDPHKGSHTAVAIGGDESELALVTVRATRRQVDELLVWAARFEDRTWAIESAGGLGYLLARQLVAAGEQVLDVPATLAARVRVLGTGRSNKNDPNDALSIAVAALRAPRLARVGRDDHAGVLRLYAKRNHDLGRARSRTACRLHALLAELVPGGIPKEINARSAERLLAMVEPVSPVERARHALAYEQLEDLRRFDEQLRASKARLAAAVGESGTTVTELFGVGPVVAAMVIGYTGDVSRFRNRDHFAAYTGTAPIEVSSGGRITHRLSRRGNRQLNHAIHMAAITQIRFAHSPGRPFFDRKVAEGKTKREALRALKRRISDAIYRQLLHDATNTGPGGQTGTALQSSVTGLTPQRPALRRSHSRTQANGRTRQPPTAKTPRSRTTTNTKTRS